MDICDVAISNCGVYMHNYDMFMDICGVAMGNCGVCMHNYDMCVNVCDLYISHQSSTQLYGLMKKIPYFRNVRLQCILSGIH